MRFLVLLLVLSTSLHRLDDLLGHARGKLFEFDHRWVVCFGLETGFLGHQ